MQNQCIALLEGDERRAIQNDNLVCKCRRLRHSRLTKTLTGSLEVLWF